MSRYKLYYFNEKGRGEIIRLIFAAAGQKYEDIRIDDPDWPEFKQKAPFGQVPFLEVTYNGKILKIAQSLTISRFLARKFDLAGKTLEEQVEVEMYGDQIDDLLSEIFRVQYEKDGAKKEESVNKLYEETIPYYFKIFDEIVGKKNGFFTSGLTWADLFMMHLIESLNDRNDKILTNFFNLKTLYEKVRQNKKIAEWIAKRPQNQI